MRARRLTPYVLLGALSWELVASNGCAGAPIPSGPTSLDATPGYAPEATSPDVGSLVDANTSADHLAAVVTDSSVAPPPDACTGLVLCDDFESAAVGGAPSAATWSIVQPDCHGAGSLSIDDSQAHSGTRSVKVVGGGGYCDHVFFANTNAMTVLGQQVYARLFLRLGAQLGAGHVTFLAMKDAADGNLNVRMGGQNGVLMYNRQSDDATLPVMSPAGVAMSAAPSALVWMCVELHIDEAAGTIDTWVDGQEVAGLVENGTPTPDVSTQWLARVGWRPALTDFKLGWESYSGQTMTLWFDDVALGDHRIGCGT